jgi:hypothetical protein
VKLFANALLIVFAGCAYDLPALIFEPAATPEASLVYSNGIPMAATVIDSTSVFLTMDRVALIGSDHFRLWVTCENVSDLPVFVDPEKMFSLIAVPKSTSQLTQEFRMEPQSPEFLLRIEQAEIDQNILRKNTLFKNQSVNGYVYFRQNMQVYSESGRYLSNCNPGEFDYKVIVQLYGESRTVEFKSTQSPQ